MSPETAKIVAVVPCLTQGSALTSLDYTAHLINSAGEKIPVLISFLERTAKDDVLIQLMEFHFAALNPGNYVLYIFAHEPMTKAVSHVQVPLTVHP